MIVDSIDQFFIESRAVLREHLSNEEVLHSFKEMPDVLLSYMWADKMNPTPRPKPENSEIVTTKAGGAELSSYEANNWISYNLKGYWIPESEGEFFEANAESSCSLIRQRPNGKEFLFLIHPKSEQLFAPLIEKYRTQVVYISALSLSSYQTFLIAVPGPNNAKAYTYSMVKLSLNEMIGDSSLILPLKKCACSVGTTAVLSHKDCSITFFSEDAAFVPDGWLLDKRNELALLKGAGMIHRSIPGRLLTSGSFENREYIIPFFSLFGNDNKLLNLLCEKSKKSLMEFIDDFLLKRLSEILIDLIFNKCLGIEFNPQNLLLAIDNTNSQNIKIDFLFSDMGGVNYLLSNQDRVVLPNCLKNPDYYYVDSHFNDTARSLQNSVNAILDILTSCSLSIGKGDLKRYYEKIFSKMLLQNMLKEGVFRKFVQEKEHEALQFFETRLTTQKNSSNDMEWFEDLICRTYPAYIRKGYNIKVLTKDEDKLNVEHMQALIENACRTSQAQPRLPYTPSADLFEVLIKEISQFLDSPYVLKTLRENSYLFAMREQVKNNLKHVNLTCKKVHQEYCHVPVIGKPYPFKPTLNALKSVDYFIKALRGHGCAKMHACQNAAEIPEKMKALKNENLSFVKSLSNNPIHYLNEFKSRIQSQGGNAKFAEFGDIMMFLDMTLNQKTLFDVAYQNPALEYLRQMAVHELKQVKNAGYPYCDTLDAIEHCLGFFDVYERGVKNH